MFRTCIAVLISFFCTCPLVTQEIEFHVVIPSYNNNKIDAQGKNWIEKNLESVFSQTYSWRLTYINDASKDGTGSVAEAYAEKRGMLDRCRFINNPTNRGALANLYTVISECSPEQVIVLLDGDDELANNTVLARVAKEYQKKNAWITYGSYVQWPGSGRGIGKRYSKEEMRKQRFRKVSFRTSHLRTFYAKLFQNIKKADLLTNYDKTLKNKEKEARLKNVCFFKGGWDLIIMFPMLEMASRGHIRYIKDILYHWNCSNPISDCRVHSDEQKYANQWVRSQPPYRALTQLFPTKTHTK